LESKLPWKQSKAEERWWTTVDPAAREKLEAIIEERRSHPGLACSVCDQPAVVVRYRMPPPSPHGGEVTISICQFCEGHNNPAGFAEFDRVKLEAEREGRTSTLPGGLTALDK
jgi:hypothetical protein